MESMSPPPSDNLFVSSLPEGIDDAMLQEIFGQYGTVVQCKVLPNLKGGQCSGLVRYSSLEEATWICENLPGTVPQGLAEVVQVRYANAPGGKGGKGGEGDDRPSPYGGGASFGGASFGGGAGFSGAGDFKKLKLCHFFEQGGCTRGAACSFAHGPAELGTSLGAGDPSGGNDSGWEVAPGFSRAPGLGKGGPGPAATAMLGAMTPMKGGFGKGGGDFDGGNFGKGGGGGKGGKGGKKGAVSIGMVVQGLFKSGCLPGGNSYSNDENTLFVKGLPFDTDDFNLYTIFSPFGAIAPNGIRAMLNPDGTCKGIAFINFLDESGTASAIHTLDGCQLPDGSMLSVQVKQEGKGKGKAKNMGKGMLNGGMGTGMLNGGMGAKTEEQTMAELEAALAAGDLDTLTALGLGDAFGLQT